MSDPVETWEVRWFLPGSSPISADALFPDGQSAQRCDWYAPSDGDNGIKLREGQMQIKTCLNTPRRWRAHGWSGRWAAYRKWSADWSGSAEDLALLERRGWLPVRKLRTTWQVAQEKGGNCQCELARIIVDSQQWWTFGLEVSGMRCESEADDWARAALRYLPMASLAEVCTESHSWDYAAWIRWFQESHS